MGLLRRTIFGPRHNDPHGRSPSSGLKFNDLRLMAAMRRHGADLSQPRHVLHYLYFDRRDDAERAGAEVVTAGWQVEIEEPVPEGSAQWLLRAEQFEAVLAPVFVRDSTDLMESVAAINGGVYDGWEAAI